MSDIPKIGIDIGSASIKLVELAPVGRNKWKLLGAAAMPSPVGGIVGNPNNLGVISQSIAKMIREAGVRSRKVVAALPEEQISSHVVEMPFMSDDEIKQALQWQVEQYIPIPADKAVWSHQVIKKDPSSGEMEILLVAAAKTLVNSYNQVLDQAGLEVLALETELMATARAEVLNDVPLSLIVDIGAKSTDLGIVQMGQLVFARTIPTAGEAFTRAIETALNMDTEQAEQYKNSYGFSADKLGGKLTDAMKPVLAVIATEIKKTTEFYVSKHSGTAMKMVTLSGGVAALPEVVGALSGMLGMEVAVGDPFRQVELTEAQSRSLAGNGPFYAVAVGLAMRQVV
jgi:type IV pilus assembly protein PilM